MQKPRELKPSVLALVLSLLLICVALPARAADLTGAIRGTVTDSDGLAVPGVVINATSDNMLGGRSTETGPEGEYRLVNLPPGDYRVEAAKAGFGTTAVVLRVATGLTSRADLTLQLATASEEITVTATKPTVDTTSVRQGVVLSKEMMRDIPNAGRSYQSAMQHAAGVVDNGTGNPNMHGAVSFGNQYFVDGVNTTDPLTSTFSMNMNFDAIEEIQVVTGGFDAEYGRSMGGAVNVVTRSGGNDFEGDAQLLYNGTRTQIYKPLPEELELSDENGNGVLDPEELPVSQSASLALNLGGPIIQDKAWFFSGVQIDRNATTLNVPKDVNRPEAMQSEDWRSAYLFGKVTWQPVEAHRLWIQGQTDPTNIDNADRSIYTLPNAESWWQQGGWLASLGHIWTPDEATVVETQLFTSQSYIKSRPMAWKDCASYDDNGFCTDDFSDQLGWYAADGDGFNWGLVNVGYYTNRSRNSLNSSVTRYYDDFFGSHEAKVGISAEQMGSKSRYPGYENGIPTYQHDGDAANLEGYTPYDLTVYDSSPVDLTGTLVGAYIQDAWQPFDRLTLRPGVRMDYSTFKNNLGEKVYDSLVFAPRMGAAYDVMGDGKTRAHAYYGRFYDSGFLAISSILSKGTNGADVYYWDDRAGDWGAEPAYSYSDSFLVHDDLKVPYSDEYDLGLARDMGDGWGVGVTGTYKVSHNLWEDDEVNILWDENGETIIGSRDGSGDLIYRLRTPDEAFIEYTSLEFEANREFDEHWGMLSSYTWSRAYGRDRDDVNQDLASASYDITEQQQYEVGLMSYDVPHAVKVAGSYRNADRWEIGSDTGIGYLFGWNFELSSGTPYRPAYYQDYYGQIYKESIDGDYRLPAYSSTDLKGGLTLRQGRTKWDLTVECFNFFNDRTVLAVETLAYDAEGNADVDEEGNVSFGQPLYRQSPRYLQLGLRGEF